MCRRMGGVALYTARTIRKERTGVMSAGLPEMKIIMKGRSLCGGEMARKICQVEGIKKQLGGVKRSKPREKTFCK